MAWIETIPPEQATGELKKEYEAAIKRAGRVYNVVRLQSLNPAVLHGSINLYLALMHGPSPLTGAQQEMIATVVSRANHCFY